MTARCRGKGASRRARLCRGGALLVLLTAASGARSGPPQARGASAPPRAPSRRGGARRPCDFAEGCGAEATQVRFGTLGLEQRFCREHKQAAHHNLDNYHARALCQHVGGCNKLGTFGANVSAITAGGGSNETDARCRPRQALFCKQHKQPGEKTGLPTCSGRTCSVLLTCPACELRRQESSFS
jgi:hypothetical protein